jgi:hypothetical protein
MSVTHRHGLSESHTHDAIDYAEHQRPMDDEVVESDTRLDSTVGVELPKFDGSLTAAAGWDMMPPTTVKRGGLKWPDVTEASYAQKVSSYERHMAAERAHRQKRHKEWMSTVRVLGVLFLLALVLLGMMDALPWQ